MSSSQSSDFYPCVLRTDPPTVLTKEEVDSYFRQRGTVVSMLTIPALAQGGPGDDSNKIRIPEGHLRSKRMSDV